MGSKYRLAPRLAELFATLPDGPAVDAFSGSGVVAHTLKAAGREVTANDQLQFAADDRRGASWPTTARRLAAEDVDALCRPNRRRPRLHRDDLRRPLLPARRPRVPRRRLVARRRPARAPSGRSRISSLCLAAAWKQPRGVFTVTTPRYDDGRRQLRMSLEELFREAVDAFNAAVIPGSGRRRAAATSSTSTRRRARRLPRPAVRAAARRRLLRQALPLPRGPRDVLARPGDHVGDRARASCASATRRSRPNGPHGPRWTTCSRIFSPPTRWSSPTAPTRTSARRSSRRSSAATGAA